MGRKKISVFGSVLNQISAETERLNNTETKTEMHTETEILAETDTETESFRSLLRTKFSAFFRPSNENFCSFQKLNLCQI